MKSAIICLLFILGTKNLRAQDPEFPKEFIMHAKLHGGFISVGKGVPELYVGGIQVVPQYTLVKNLIRGGLIADAFYTNRELAAAFGPALSVKIKNFNLRNLGSGGNVHLSFDHLWTTRRQRLLGIGVHADLLNLFTIGITGHRDYRNHTVWYQGSFGVRISKVKKPEHP